MMYFRAPEGLIPTTFVVFALMFVTMETDGQQPFPSFDNMKAYTAQYRVAALDKKYVMWAKESYDSQQRRVRLDFMKNGKNSTLMLDFASDFYISYSYDSSKKSAYDCVAKQLGPRNDDPFDPYNFKEASSGSKIPHTVSTMDMLQFLKESNPVYEEAELDGLSVDKWTVTKDLYGKQLTLKYYFTVADFGTFGYHTNSQVPFRAEVTLKGNTGTMEHDYSYIEFKAFKSLPEEVFSLPEFTVCKDVIQWNSRSLTGVGDITYTLETVKHTKSQVSVDVKTVSRDISRSLFREDTSQVTSISDFGTGVEYVIDGRSCNIRPIDPINVTPATVAENNMLTMGDTREIKYLRGNFSLTGYKNIRSIPAVGLAKESKEEGYLVEGYFEETDADPLSLTVYYPASGEKTYYHFYNIEKSANQYGGDPFDIRRCRSSDEVMDFDLTLDIGKVTEFSIKRYIDRVIVDLKKAVAKVADVSTLQVSHNDYYVDTENREFHWYGAFLGPDLEEKKANVVNRLEMKVPDDILSAVRKAIEAKSLSIKYSDTQSFRAVRIQTERDDFSLAIQDDDALFRFNKKDDQCINIRDSKFISSATNTERACAQACVDNQWVDCNAFQYTKETKSCYFGRQTKSPKLSETPGCDYYSLSYLESFNAFPGTVLLKKKSNGKSVDVKSAELCAERCIDEESFECESIDFCEESSRCVLYDVRDINKDNNAVGESEQQSTCKHYTRKSRDDYEITTSTSLRFPGQVTETTNSVSECADQCTSNKDSCRVFSACGYDGKFMCTIVPKSQETSVTYMPDSDCNVYNLVTPGSSAQTGSCPTCGNNGVRSDAVASGFTLGEMIGIGIAMALTGIAVGAIAGFLLYRFQSGGQA